MAPDPSDLPIDPTGTILSSDQTALLSYLVWICGKFDLYRLTEPANSRHLTNVVLMLADRLRRWTNVKPHWLNVSCFLERLWGCRVSTPGTG